MEYLNYSLYFSLLWLCFLSLAVLDNGLKEILDNKISFDGFWSAFFVPVIIVCLIEYLIVR